MKSKRSRSRFPRLLRRGRASLDARTKKTDHKDVKGAEFLRKVKRLGDRRGTTVRFEKKRGKGSHGTLYFGTARAILQDLKRELPAGTLHAMLKQLGLVESDLQE